MPCSTSRHVAYVKKSQTLWMRRKACCTPRRDHDRVRRAGQRYFVDVTISVPRTASLEQAHAASDAVEQRIGRIVPADVVVHVEPRARIDEPLIETVRAIAQRRGLAVHELSVQQYEGNLFIELHLEVNEESSLREAHRQADGLPRKKSGRCHRSGNARQHSHRTTRRAHCRSRGHDGALCKPDSGLPQFASA